MVFLCLIRSVTSLAMISKSMILSGEIELSFVSITQMEPTLYPYKSIGIP